MTVQLFEGCWGVTRGGEKRGPMVPNLVTPSRIGAWKDNGLFLCDQSRPFWHDNGEYWPGEPSQHNIIAVFDTEDEVDAYLAEETDAVAAEIQRDMLARSDSHVPPAPKPVTWPDGVTKMTIGPHQITIDAETGVIQVVWHGSVGSTPAQARQLAALLLAAADKVEGRG